MSINNLAQAFIAPNFQEKIYEKELFLFPESFQTPFNITTFQNLLWSTRDSLSNYIQISKNSQQIGIDHINQSNPLSWLYEKIDEGFSIAFNRPERVSYEVSSLIYEFQRATGFNIATSFFYTPPHSECFLPHIDGIDVLFLQLEGEKIWNLQSGNRKLPLREEGKEVSFNDKKPIDNIMLHPGACLYVPRGFIHQGQAGVNGSLHMTIGLYPTLLKDVLSSLVETVSKRSHLLRRTIFTDSVDMFELAEEIKNSLKLMEDFTHIFLKENLNFLDYSHTAKRFTESPKAFRDLPIPTKQKDGHLTYIKNPHVLSILELKIKSCQIRFMREKKDEVISLPITAFNTVEKMLDGAEFNLYQLPDDLELLSRKKLVDRLELLGLITISEDI